MALMQVTGRKCENCGLGMLPFVPRKRGPDGKLWCQNCHEGRPGRPRAQASRSGELGTHPDALSPTTVEAVLAMEAESERLEAAEAILGNWAMPDRLLVVVGHDSGDGQTIFHCPFCGGGQVVGRADGTTECDFCHQAFTVQVQPQISAMPQTVNGQPIEMPGMPGGPPSPDAPFDQDAAAGAAQPPGAPQDAFVPPGAPGAAPAPPGGQGQPFQPPATKAASLQVEAGDDDMVPAESLKPGDRFIHSITHPIPVEVVRANEDHTDRFGRKMKQHWIKDPATGREGSFPFGPGGVVKRASLQVEAGRFPCAGSNADPLPSTERHGSRYTQITPTFGQHHESGYGVCPTCQEPKKLLASGKLPKHTRYLSWKDQQEMGHESAKQPFFIGPDGVAMPHESYIRHLALRFADDRDAVLADIRESNLA